MGGGCRILCGRTAGPGIGGNSSVQTGEISALELALSLSFHYPLLYLL